jgi:hypothetical protein
VGAGRDTSPYTPGVEEWESPDYPWRVVPPRWSPAAGLTEAERRRRYCGIMFDTERTARELGDADPRLVYDAEHDLYRFPDGRFALSREHADWHALKEAGFFEGEI